MREAKKPGPKPRELRTTLRNWDTPRDSWVGLSEGFSFPSSPAAGAPALAVNAPGILCKMLCEILCDSLEVTFRFTLILCGILEVCGVCGMTEHSRDTLRDSLESYFASPGEHCGTWWDVLVFWRGRPGKKYVPEL